MKNENFILKGKQLSNFEVGSIDYAIYQTILNNADQIPNLSLTDFAKLCFASKPSILKFCHKIGLSGYAELKYSITKNLIDHLPLNSELSVSKSIVSNNEFNQYYAKIAKKYLDYLFLKFNEDKVKIDNLVQQMKTKQKIFIFGINLAYYACKDFQQKMRWMNQEIILSHDIQEIESYCAQMDNTCLVVLITLSGNNPHIMQINNWIKPEVYRFVLSGNQGEITKKAQDYFLIPNYETELWDNFSLRSRFVGAFFDLLFMTLFN